MLTGTSGGDAALFQAPRVTVLRAAGHTSGHQCVLQAPSDVPQFGDRNMRRKLLAHGRLRHLCGAGVRVFLSHGA
ncbi:hypothetical protein [Streptomyces pseudogriseolus]|uniref:hypothetical protein n=1 Tax=Streptomyces pseudogriseolus TaxID=36817 RepID=UPI003FA2371C